MLAMLVICIRKQVSVFRTRKHLFNWLRFHLFFLAAVNVSLSCSIYFPCLFLHRSNAQQQHWFIRLYFFFSIFKNKNLYLRWHCSMACLFTMDKMLSLFTVKRKLYSQLFHGRSKKSVRRTIISLNEWMTHTQSIRPVIVNTFRSAIIYAMKSSN